MDDTLVIRFGAIVGPAWPAGSDRTFLPGGSPVSDEALPAFFAGFRLTTDVVAASEPAGVLFALGDWNGGCALFVTHRPLASLFSRGGRPPGGNPRQTPSPGPPHGRAG